MPTTDPAATTSRKRGPRRVSIPSQYQDAISRWTVAKVRCALDEHEAGRFYSSAALAEAVLRDPQVMGDLATRVRALASRAALPFTVEASDSGDGRKKASITKRVGALWWDCLPETTVAAILRDSIMLGVAVGWIQWHDRNGEWVPELIPLPAHGLEYRSGERKWTYTTDEGETLDVKPGDGTWFLHLPNGPRSWMQGAIRSVAMPWIRRAFAWRDWARWSEKHGLPMLAVKEPHNSTDDVDGESETAAQSFYAQFRNFGSESVLRLPQGQSTDEPGWDAKWLEPQAVAFNGFRQLLRDARAEITVALLGKDTGEGSTRVGGDGASVLERVRVEYLASDAEPLSTSLRSQFWKPFVHFNHGANDVDATPWGRWNTRPPPDLAARASTLKTAAEAIRLLEGMGIDTRPFLDELQLSARGASGPEISPATPAPTEPPTNGAAEAA